LSNLVGGGTGFNLGFFIVLLFLLALLLVLFGFAVGRRRPARAGA
jgi:hypothetical protein